MRGLFIFMALVVTGWIVVGPAVAAGQQKALPPNPTPAPAKLGQKPGNLSATEPATAPVDPAAVEPEPDQWSSGEIEEASRLCRDVLTRLDAEVEYLSPLREGRCGDPAPVRLISIGKADPVRFKSSPTVSCRMLEPLARWIDNGLQPAAAKHLEARVTELSVMSSYSCRTRYGRAGARISEHAFANALDIGSFGLADGRTVSVLKHWGATKRDIAEAVAVAAAKINPAAPLDAAGGPAGTQETRLSLGSPGPVDQTARLVPKAVIMPDRPAVPLPQPRDRIMRVPPLSAVALAPPLPATRQLPPPAEQSPGVRPTRPSMKPPLEASRITEQATMPPLPVRRPLRQAVTRQLSLDDRRNRPSSPSPAVFPAPPYRLGGPKPVEKSLVLFLKAAHAYACRIFGTTLGPEANEAHRNHFHVDMYPRRRGGYCE